MEKLGLEYEENIYPDLDQVGRDAISLICFVGLTLPNKIAFQFSQESIERNRNKICGIWLINSGWTRKVNIRDQNLGDSLGYTAFLRKILYTNNGYNDFLPQNTNSISEAIQEFLL